MDKKTVYSFVFALNGLRKNGKGLIQIKIYFNRNARRYISTGLYIFPNQWDDDLQKINRKHPNQYRLNFLLKQQLSEIEEFEYDCLKKKTPFTPQKLKEFLNNTSGDFYTVARKSVFDDARLGNGKSHVLAHLKAFNNICGPVALEDVSYEAIKKFDKWLHTQDYLTNTIGSYHKSLKRTINALIREDKMTKNPYARFKIKKVKTRKSFLTTSEIKRLSALHYDNGMQRTLDRFLIACGTAMRFSDVFSLHARQVYEGEQGLGLVVDLERMKKVEFPVKNPAYLYFGGIAGQRLRKYLKPDSFLFDQHNSIAMQNAIDNRNLKVIALDAEIDKSISFHTSRHTALTEVAVQTGSVFSVMKFGGIRKVDTAMIYIHLASEKF